MPCLFASRRAMARPLLTICLLLAALIASSSTADAGQGLAKRTETNLAKALNQSFAESVAEGAIAGVWIGNRAWIATRGSTQAGIEVRPVRRTHTRIGSVTKTFTATIVMQLVRERKLKLSDTIDRWFPGVTGARRITIRDLGDMSSGINSYSIDGSIVDRYLTFPRTVWNPWTLIGAGVTAPRRFPTGDGFFYSNTNFLMLGQIIEKITGRPIAQVMKRRIFKPLGMSSTSYPSRLWLPRPFWRGITNQAITGTPLRDSTNWSPTFLSSAGQIVSTIEDLGTYTKALGTGSLIGPKMQRLRLKPNPASINGTRSYRFGVGVDNGWISHSGEIPGYNTQVAYLPRKKATIVTMVNTDGANQDGDAPAPSIFAALAEVIAPANVPSG